MNDMESLGEIYVVCKDKKSCDRLKFYFDGETRPDFVEEVPESEAELFEAFESLQVPDLVNSIDGNRVSIGFDMLEEGFDEFEEMVCIAGEFNPQQVFAYYYTDEETDCFFRLENNELIFLFSLAELIVDEEEPEACLSDEEIEEDESLINLEEISVAQAREIAVIADENITGALVKLASLKNQH